MTSSAVACETLGLEAQEEDEGKAELKVEEGKADEEERGDRTRTRTRMRSKKRQDRGKGSRRGPVCRQNRRQRHAGDDGTMRTVGRRGGTEDNCDNLKV